MKNRANEHADTRHSLRLLLLFLLLFLFIASLVFLFFFCFFFKFFSFPFLIIAFQFVSIRFRLCQTTGFVLILTLPRNELWHCQILNSIQFDWTMKTREKREREGEGEEIRRASWPSINRVKVGWVKHHRVKSMAFSFSFPKMAFRLVNFPISPFSHFPIFQFSNFPISIYIYLIQYIYMCVCIIHDAFLFSSLKKSFIYLFIYLFVEFFSFFFKIWTSRPSPAIDKCLFALYRRCGLLEETQRSTSSHYEDWPSATSPESSSRQQIPFLILFAVESVIYLILFYLIFIPFGFLLFFFLCIRDDVIHTAEKTGIENHG